MSIQTDQQLADALIAWAEAFRVEGSSYKEYWNRLQGDNVEFFRRFDADKDSVILGQAYTEAMARADDDGVFRKPVFLPDSAAIRRRATSDAAEIDAMLAMLEAEAPAALAAEDERDREEWFWNQVDALTYEIRPSAWDAALERRLLDIAGRLGLSGTLLIRYPVKPVMA